jgi:hypothetical protein
VSLAAACGWDGGSAIRPRLLGISRVNDWVGEHILQSNQRLAREYPISMRTRDFPHYFVTRPMAPMLPAPETWSLEVGAR